MLRKTSRFVSTEHAAEKATATYQVKVPVHLTLETMTSLFHVLLVTKSTGEEATFAAFKALSVSFEGANMPLCDLDAIKVYKENGIFYGPAKAANVGGVAVSALK